MPTPGYVTSVNVSSHGCQKDDFSPQYSSMAVVSETAITEVLQVIHRVNAVSLTTSLLLLLFFIPLTLLNLQAPSTYRIVCCGREARFASFGRK